MINEIKCGWRFTEASEDTVIPIRNAQIAYPTATAAMDAEDSYMHEQPFEALWHASGPILQRGELSCEQRSCCGKWVTTSWRILATHDMTSMLRRYAKDQALSVATMWDMPVSVYAYLVSSSEEFREAVHVLSCTEAKVASPVTAEDAAMAAAYCAAKNAVVMAAPTAQWKAAEAAAWTTSPHTSRDMLHTEMWIAKFDAMRRLAAIEFANRVTAVFAA